ncbi:hypothetical protein [Halopelagius longus]|uniref:DUF7979 domain-containing protein n=1 Tax=Halopelagius longus TaxID=1236180 RepID=A0A1H0YU85_9EURY|nr:hypothetical protein [Halopelagius longus]RDI72681.1 hypothetical protein DWB78_13635 [Halopelagius longus]SDQ18735.1 hypothetical protein SAMN05216278_0847 [Halopelagius longus]
MSSKRTVRVLLLVGLLLLPGPVYAIEAERLDGPERHRVANGYTATPIDAENDSRLADQYAVRLAFNPEDVEYRHVASGLRAPNRTRSTLERAIRNGSATVDSLAVRSDVRRLRRNYTFLTESYDAYYAYSLSSGTVATTRANDSEIAAAVRDELVVEYETLSAAERATFRKVRNATVSEDAYDYRPWQDEPMPSAAIVERNGTHYAVETASHTDDFDFPDGLLLGVVASAVGVVCLLTSGGIWLSGLWRD